MTESAKEPGPWELYRGIERIEKALKDQAGAYVTTTAFTLEKQILLAQIGTLATKLTEQETETRQNKERADASDRFREDQKARIRLMWVSIFASPIVGAIVVWAVSGALATRT